MSEDVELFFDDTPGEVRGVRFRDGRPDRMFVQREGDAEAFRSGARSVGRVVEVSPALGVARLDLGCDGPAASLSLGKGVRLHVGQALEVEVTSEPREAKGAALRLVGPAEGPPRLLAAAPDVHARLSALAPGVTIQTGALAIRAVMEAEQEALASGAAFPEHGLDLAVQRTRALIAVDIDHRPPPGRDGRKARAAANRHGLIQAARLIGLKGWGGLVAIDLAGVGLDGSAVTAQAREAFTDWADVAYGPLSRFGLLQLSLPWREAPIEERLFGTPERRATTRAVALTRRLRLAMLGDTTQPRFTALATPDLAEKAAPLIARLGPRAGLRIDPAADPEGEIQGV